MLASWRDWDDRGDLLANILLYAPFGFFAFCALPARAPVWSRLACATLGGTVLSTAMELLQFYDAGRDCSMGDVYANTIGSALGALAAAARVQGRRWTLVRELSLHPPEAALLAAWLLYRLYPYVPTIDPHKYWHALQPALSPGLPPFELARYAGTWLLIGAIVEVLYGFRRWLLLFPLLVGMEALGQVLIIDRALHPADLAGAGIVFALRLLVPGRLPGRAVVTAGVFAALVVSLRLEPFHLAEASRAFGWVPWASLMSGSIGVAAQAFCAKFYLYGGLIWLLGQAGMRLLPATGLTALMLLATSMAQTFLPDRSAEIGDALTALMIGGAFALLARPPAQAGPELVVAESGGRE
nr:VanZ family protein [Limobrevibacterium gyesilva]